VGLPPRLHSCTHQDVNPAPSPGHPIAPTEFPNRRSAPGTAGLAKASPADLGHAPIRRETPTRSHARGRVLRGACPQLPSFASGSQRPTTHGAERRPPPVARGRGLRAPGRTRPPARGSVRLAATGARATPRAQAASEEASTHARGGLPREFETLDPLRGPGACPGTTQRISVTGGPCGPPSPR
jgi:hypothetical protein